MMLAMGCIQSLQCNNDTCPTGITIQNPALVKGLAVADKIHRETIKSVAEILAAAGLLKTEELNRSHTYRRISQIEIKSYEEIYPSLAGGRLFFDCWHA